MPYGLVALVIATKQLLSLDLKMSAKATKVLWRLTVQSWIPLLIAAIYAWWDYESLADSSRTISAFVKSLGVAFFFIMWFVGQWFRAEKQISDTDHLSQINTKVTNIEAHVVKEGQLSTQGMVPPSVKTGNSYYRWYSNGVLVQTIKLRLMPGINNFPLVFPTTFPNEVLSIQIIGDDLAWPTRVSSSNCDLKFSPAYNEREIEIIISGL